MLAQISQELNATMICSLRLSNWTVVALLLLVGLIATGCDGGPTWNDSGPPLGETDQKIGTLTKELGTIEGPNGTMLTTPEGSPQKEVSVKLGKVGEAEQSVEVPAGYQIVSDNFRIRSTSAIHQPFSKPLGIGIPIEDDLSSENVKVLVSPIGLEGGSQEKKSAILKEAEYIDKYSVVSTPIYYIQKGDTRFTAVRKRGESKKYVGIEKETYGKEENEVVLDCEPLSFENRSADPCMDFKSGHKERLEGIGREVISILKEEGYSGPRLDRKIRWNPAGGNILPERDGPYKIRVVGTNLQGVRKFFGTEYPGNYYGPAAEIFVYYEKKEGGFFGSSHLNETVRHELFHAFQWPELNLAQFSIPRFDRVAFQSQYWLLEGTASLAGTTIGAGSLSLSDRRKDFKINTPLVESSYKAQDFWYYVVESGTPEFESFAKSVMSDIRENDKNSDNFFKLYSESTSDVTERLLDKPLSSVYWSWAKNESYEGRNVDENNCSANFSSISYFKESSDLPNSKMFSIPSLTSRTIKISPSWSQTVTRDFRITRPDMQGVKMKAYKGPNQSNCISERYEGKKITLENVGSDEEIYIILSNVSENFSPPSDLNPAPEDGISYTSREVSVEFGILLPPPSNFSPDSKNRNVQLGWDEVESPSVEGYNIYKDTERFSSATPDRRINDSPIDGLSFNDSDVENGRTYYYRIATVSGATSSSRDENKNSNSSEGRLSELVEVTPLPEPPDRP